MSYSLISKDVLGIDSINITGNVIPHTWYKCITRKGRVDLNAITLLAEFVYWYKPVKVKTEEGIEQYNQKFSSDLLQYSYSDMENKFGLSKKQSRYALELLEQLGLVSKVLRNIETRKGLVCSNVLFIKINPHVIKRISSIETYESFIEEQGSALEVTISEEATSSGGSLPGGHDLVTSKEGPSDVEGTTYTKSTAKSTTKNSLLLNNTNSLYEPDELEKINNNNIAIQQEQYNTNNEAIPTVPEAKPKTDKKVGGEFGEGGTTLDEVHVTWAIDNGYGSPDSFSCFGKMDRGNCFTRGVLEQIYQEHYLELPKADKLSSIITGKGGKLCKPMIDTMLLRGYDNMFKMIKDFLTINDERGEYATKVYGSIDIRTKISDTFKRFKPKGHNGFDEFIQMYPKKEGIQEAEKAYNRVVKDEHTHKLIMKAIPMYQIAKEQYVVSPTRFLEEKIWIDFEEKEGGVFDGFDFALNQAIEHMDMRILKKYCDENYDGEEGLTLYVKHRRIIWDELEKRGADTGNPDTRPQAREAKKKGLKVF